MADLIRKAIIIIEDINKRAWNHPMTDTFIADLRHPETGSTISRDEAIQIMINRGDGDTLDWTLTAIESSEALSILAEAHKL